MTHRERHTAGGERALARHGQTGFFPVVGHAAPEQQTSPGEHAVPLARQQRPAAAPELPQEIAAPRYESRPQQSFRVRQPWPMATQHT